jgi:hypothetical protein
LLFLSSQILFDDVIINKQLEESTPGRMVPPDVRRNPRGADVRVALGQFTFEVQDL